MNNLSWVLSEIGLFKTDQPIQDGRTNTSIDWSGYVSHQKQNTWQPRDAGSASDILELTELPIAA